MLFVEVLCSYPVGDSYHAGFYSSFVSQSRKMLDMARLLACTSLPVRWSVFIPPFGAVQSEILSVVQQLHLTSWSTVLEKLTRPQLVKKFPAFYGTRRFATAFTRWRHLFLSRAISDLFPIPLLKDPL